MLASGGTYTVDRVVRMGVTAGICAALIYLLAYLSDVLIPFAVAFLLAYLVNPLVGTLQNRIRNRTVSVFLTLLLVVLVFALLVWRLTPVMVEEIGRTGKILSEVVHNSEVAQRAAAYLPEDLWQVLRDYASRTEVQEFFRTENFWKIAEAVARRVMPGVWGLITGTASLLTGLLGLGIIALYLVFLLIDYPKITRNWQDLLPASYREPVTAFVGDFNAAMGRYFRAQAVVAAVAGVMYVIGFSMIGLPLSILLGLGIGLLNMVPYLQLVGLVPAFLLALVHALETGAGLWIVLGWTGLVFVAVQIVQDVFLVPRIMGRITGLSPAILMLSVSIWGKLLGIFGLLIALPMTCLLLAYYKRILAASSPHRPSQA